MRAIVLIMSSVLLPAPALAQYTFTTVNYPGAAITRLVGINDHGEIVGNYTMPGSGQLRHAFKYVKGEFIPLDPTGLLGMNASAANQINNRGDISGWYSTAPGTRHGYILSDGVITTIDYPGASFTQVNGITDTGTIFGHFREGSTDPFHGFTLKDGVFTQLDFPGAFSTLPFYINTRGDIAGQWNERPFEVGHGFVLTHDGQWISVDAPGAAPNSTFAIGINDHRQILGEYFDTSGHSHTFIVSANDLTPDAFTVVEMPWDDATPETANSSGIFVGFYFDATGGHGFIATPH